MKKPSFLTWLFHFHCSTFPTFFCQKQKISTSNWSGKQLSPQQINYAAADAYAALLIYQHLYHQQLLPPQIQQQIVRILQGSADKA
jgi:hypothetical protein